MKPTTKRLTLPEWQDKIAKTFIYHMKDNSFNYESFDELRKSDSTGIKIRDCKYQALEEYNKQEIKYFHDKIELYKEALAISVETVETYKNAQSITSQSVQVSQTDHKGEPLQYWGGLEYLNKKDNPQLEAIYLQVSDEEIQKAIQKYMFKEDIGLGFAIGIRWRERLSTGAGSQWVSVEDRLPEEKTEVFAKRRFSKQIITQSWEDYTGQNSKWFKQVFSYWLPITQLPSPPKNQ